jgi:hypothetical protein
MQNVFHREHSLLDTISHTNVEKVSQPKVKLIYRGNTFYRNSSPVVLAAQPLEKTGGFVTLIYRGNTYHRSISAPKAYRQPVAINWRWQQTSS